MVITMKSLRYFILLVPALAGRLQVYIQQSFVILRYVWYEYPLPCEEYSPYSKSAFLDSLTQCLRQSSWYPPPSPTPHLRHHPAWPGNQLLVTGTSLSPRGRTQSPRPSPCPVLTCPKECVSPPPPSSHLPRPPDPRRAPRW